MRLDSASPSLAFMLVGAMLLLGLPLHAGGPRIVAGSTYFDPAQSGHPVLWLNGTVHYFTDQGALSVTVSNNQAATMVAAAASAWNIIPTAAVLLTSSGTLAENVSGQNVTASANGVTMPPDVQGTATGTPLAIIYDSDGSVIDALYGVDASDPDDCINTGAIAAIDNLAPSGAILHAWIILNGRCTGTPTQLQQMQFQTMRAFGRILGLDWSQANDAVLFAPASPSLQELQGWPVMRPIDIYCNQLSTQCLPNPLQLRPDDIAAVSRLYPVTEANLTRYPAKHLTAASTISIHGNLFFRRGQGMQGVNIVARPVNPGSLQPEDQYATSAVTGSLFSGNRGSPISGPNDASGRPFSDFGSDDPVLQGSYDLSGLALPPGQTQVDYRLTLEAINPLYTGSSSVGPYTAGSPIPSGTLTVLTLHNLVAGSSIQQDIVLEDSAGDLQSGTAGTFSSPAMLPSTGEWAARLATPGSTTWFALPVLAGRHLTVEAEATDEAGHGTQNKLRPSIGIWNGSAGSLDPPTNSTTSPFNAPMAGTTSLGIDAIANGELLLAVSDQRGDGRPDYTYRGRILYAATVVPSHLPLTGGQLRIKGSGFRPGMTVAFGTSITAVISQLTPGEIVASVPAVSSATGSLDLIVHDPATNGTAVIAGGISYGAASTDTLTLTAAPPPTLAIGATAPFTVQVLGANQVTPVGGVAVAFSILQGTGTFTPCGAAQCTTITTGDGLATVGFIPGSTSAIRLLASTPGGATLAADLTGTASPALSPTSLSISLAPGVSLPWNSQVTAIAGGVPVPGATVTWQGDSALGGQGGSSVTNAQGLAGFTFNLGPWIAGTSGTIHACLANLFCASIPVFAVHLESENLVAVSGLDQTASIGDLASPVVVRLVTPAGQPVIGGAVTFHQVLRQYAPVCHLPGNCPIGRLLGSSSITATSDLNGLATFVPLLPAGTAVSVSGLVEAGSNAVLIFHLDIHP